MQEDREIINMIIELESYRVEQILQDIVGTATVLLFYAFCVM